MNGGTIRRGLRTYFGGSAVGGGDMQPTRPAITHMDRGRDILGRGRIIVGLRMLSDESSRMLYLVGTGTCRPDRPAGSTSADSGLAICTFSRRLRWGGLAT